MTGKRLKKLYMAMGVPRDTADFISKHVRMKHEDGRFYSHQEFFDNAKLTVKRKSNEK